MILVPCTRCSGTGEVGSYPDGRMCPTCDGGGQYLKLEGDSGKLSRAGTVKIPLYLQIKEAQ